MGRSWRAMNRRRRERSRYAWLGAQATVSSLTASDSAGFPVAVLDMLDSDALCRCENRPLDCCRRLAAGQATWTDCAVNLPVRRLVGEVENAGVEDLGVHQLQRMLAGIALQQALAPTD